MGGLDIEEVLSSTNAIQEWEKAKNHLGYDDTRMIEFARQVNCLTLPLEEIKCLIRHRFFQFKGQSLIPEFLFSKAVEASGKKTAVDIVRLRQWFGEKQISLNPKSTL